MIMNKDDFCRVMNGIRQIHLLQERVNDQFRAYRNWSKDDFAEFDFPTLETELIKTLEIMFDDVEYQNISWWIYDCNMGKADPDLLTITYPDGSKRVIQDEQKLYDFLIDEMEKVNA